VLNNIVIVSKAILTDFENVSFPRTITSCSLQVVLRP